MAHCLTGAVCSGVKKINSFFVAAQRGFLCFIMALLTVSMFAEIITRYFFNTSLFGLEEFVGFTAVWVYFIGASYGSYERSHIKAEFVEVLFRKPRSANAVKTLAGVVSTWMSLIFTKWSYTFVMESIQMDERSPTYDVPMVLFQSALLVGAVLMTVYFLWETIEFAYYTVKGKEDDAPWKE